jgi:hypothetical protein
MREETTNEILEVKDENSSLTRHTCKSCRNQFMGSYCNLCGEKVLEANDRSFRSFVSNIFAFTDNKFFKTLWLIIRKPGLLSKEYAEGRRVAYLRPLQLFFVLNLVYFLFPFLPLFNASLKTQLYLRTHSLLVRTMVYSETGGDNLALQGYELMYNQKSMGLAKLLIFVFVLLASVPMMIIYRRRNRFFTDHVTLAVELTCFNLMVNAIGLTVLLMAVNKLLHWSHSGWERYLDDTSLTVIFVITNAYFLFRAGRTFYAQKGKILVLKVALGLLGLFIALEAYRLALFLVTFWSL